MKKEIISVVFSFIKPEFVNNAMHIYQELVENKEMFKGCLDLKLFRKVNHPYEFMAISKWTSIEDRNEHMKSEFFIKAEKKLKQYRRRDPIVNNFEWLNVKDER